MDILSHGLWGTAAALTSNDLKGTKLPARWAFWWGIFPDFFAFAPVTIYVFWTRVVRGVPIPYPRPDALEPTSGLAARLFSFTPHLYNLTHSFVIFALVFGMIYTIFRKRTPWEMLAWPLHILFDIPTHSYQFYPTPFLWPISNIKVNGYSWAHPWFLAADYTTLAIVFSLLWYRRRKLRAKN